MARPQKNTVTYFPLDCEQGKKMYYIEETYGNDGYATFIKLLQELARTDNHYLDLSKNTTIMFLSAKCKVSKETLILIINDLVDLDKFDLQLWDENRIIWCQDFIDSIQDAYLKRKNKCIDRNSLLQLLEGLGVRKPLKSTPKLSFSAQNNPNNTQSKVEYSKVNEIIEDKTKEVCIGASPENKKFNFRKSLLDYGFEQNLTDDWLTVRKNKKASNTETAFKAFISEIESKECNYNEMLAECVKNSWSGFKHVWIDNLNKNNTNGNGNNNQPKPIDERWESINAKVDKYFS